MCSYDKKRHSCLLNIYVYGHFASQTHFTLFDLNESSEAPGVIFLQCRKQTVLFSCNLSIITMCGQTSDKQKRYATKWSMLIITIMEQVALMRIVCCDLLRWRTLGQDEKEFQVFFAGSKTAYSFRGAREA